MDVKLEIKLARYDSLPAFGAFLRCEAEHEHSPTILLNVEACMAPDYLDEDGNSVELTREDRKRLIISTIMHEVGHALEQHFRLPVNEEAIEKACIDWEEAFAKQTSQE